MSKIYNRNMDLFIFEHVQFSESEMSVIRKHRTYNFCNRKCRKIGKYVFPRSQNVNKLKMYLSSNVIYSNVSTDRKQGNKIKINETNTFLISAFEYRKLDQYTCEKKWYEFFHLGSLICLNLSLNQVKLGIFNSKCRKSKIGTSTCLYLNTLDFRICCKIENWNIQCSLLENIGHTFPHSKMSTMSNRKIHIFVFQNIRFPLDTFIAQTYSNQNN